MIYFLHDIVILETLGTADVTSAICLFIPIASYTQHTPVNLPKVSQVASMMP
jgi:hypothetical protein